MAEQFDRFFRIRRTIMQMLDDRGYLVAADEIAMTKEEFRERHGSDPKRDDLALCKSRRSNPDDKVLVFFPDEAKVSVKTIRVIAERMKTENIRQGIIVAQASLSPFAKASLAQMSSQYKVEVFLESELLVNVKEHFLVPEHIVLTSEEKQELLQRYTVKESQLPRMLEQDPVARYYGLRKGQVVKIIRPSETAGKYVTYRFVV